MGNIIVYDKIKAHKMFGKFCQDLEALFLLFKLINSHFFNVRKCFCSDNILKCDIELTHP